MDGFSYRGKSISAFGNVLYAPDVAARGEWALPYEVREKELNGRDGEYYYGSRIQARDFKLRCYFDDMSQSDLEDMLEWFDPKTKGRLIFDDRPYVYYDVIPNGKPDMTIYRVKGCNGLHYVGTIVFFLKAYEPYGKLLVVNSDGQTMGAENETLLIPSSKTPTYTPASSATTHSFLIYNPGTKPTPLTLR